MSGKHSIVEDSITDSMGPGFLRPGFLGGGGGISLFSSGKLHFSEKIGPGCYYITQQIPSIHGKKVQ